VGRFLAPDDPSRPADLRRQQELADVGEDRLGLRHARRIGEAGPGPSYGDDGAGFLKEYGFPGASDFVHVERPLDAAAETRADDRTYGVVMTHNYLRDMDYLRSFLGTEVAYIGMLGPRRRLERLLGDLAGQDVHPSEADLRKIHGPAGLDVGADGPEEIAAAIVAELVAVHRDRPGGFLRDREGPIHDRPAPLEAVP
jgi:xanthine dehydrogenase accessory factor